MGKIPMDEIKKELKSAGISEKAVKELLHVLSIKSLRKLEGLVEFSVILFRSLFLCKITAQKVE